METVQPREVQLAKLEMNAFGVPAANHATCAYYYYRRARQARVQRPPYYRIHRGFRS
jgi:hypothetical protein